MTRRLATVIAAVAMIFAAAGCEGAFLAAPIPSAAPAPLRSPMPSTSPDPVAITLPADDGAHDRLTEWWYYTGHLADASGGRYGFELVVFRAERGDVPVSWASHLAITDETAGTFRYAQRAAIGPGTDVTASLGSDAAFGLRVGDPAWSLARIAGTDTLQADASAADLAASGGGAPFGLDLRATTTLPEVLHDGDGWIDFGPGGGSYYYSRPRLETTGTLTLDGIPRSVIGTAWFDHQWGDFIAIGGGWDWFAVNLDDGTDLTVSSVRDAQGRPALVYGTLVGPDGGVRHLPSDGVGIEPQATWVSPRTGAIYPAGWRITVPGDDLVVDLAPTVADQELDTRATTGVVYWEGSQRVAARRAGQAIPGQGYVELTGYLDRG